MVCCFAKQDQRFIFRDGVCSWFCVQQATALLETGLQNFYICSVTKQFHFLVSCIGGVDTFLSNKHQARANCLLCVLLDFENAREFNDTHL